MPYKSIKSASLRNVPLFIFILLFASKVACAQSNDCFALLESDTLILGNELVVHKWVWNKGNMMLHSVCDKKSGDLISFNQKQPFFRAGNSDFQSNIDFEVQQVAKTLDLPAHLEVSIVNQYSGFQLKRVIRIYPATPAIANELYLKYESLT